MEFWGPGALCARMDFLATQSVRVLNLKSMGPLVAARLLLVAEVCSVFKKSPEHRRELSWFEVQLVYSAVE